MVARRIVEAMIESTPRSIDGGTPKMIALAELLIAFSDDAKPDTLANGARSLATKLGFDTSPWPLRSSFYRLSRRIPNETLNESVRSWVRESNESAESPYGSADVLYGIGKAITTDPERIDRGVFELIGYQALHHLAGAERALRPDYGMDRESAVMIRVMGVIGQYVSSSTASRASDQIVRFM